MNAPAAPGPDVRLAGLSRLARSLSGARSVREVAEKAAEEARFAFGASAVSVSRLEREHGLVRVVVNVGRLAPGEARFPRDEVYRIADFPLLAAMVDEARPWTMQVSDAEGDDAQRELLARLDAVSALAAPVLAEGRVWGELFATRAAGEPSFGPDDTAFAEAFAGLVAAGLAQVEHLDRVQRLALEDPLTGLGNRRLVEDRLDEALEDFVSTGAPLSLVMADVNGLKRANDRFGHDKGDEALVAVATALSLATGTVPGAVAGRLGGDEFCVVLPGYGLDVATALGAAFLRGSAGAPHQVTVAVGVASTELGPDVTTRKRLLALADEAQYRAKRTRSREPVTADPGVLAADRRGFRGRADAGALLEAALDRVAAVPAGPDAVRDRLVAVAEHLVEELELSGWVVSRIRVGAAIPIAHGSRRPGVLSSASVPAGPSVGWLSRARSHGVVVGAAEDDAPLAGVRGCAAVVAAAAGEWLVELLADRDDPSPDLAVVLRAAVAVAATPG